MSGRIYFLTLLIKTLLTIYVPQIYKHISTDTTADFKNSASMVLDKHYRAEKKDYNAILFATYL